MLKCDWCLCVWISIFRSIGKSLAALWLARCRGQNDSAYIIARHGLSLHYYFYQRPQYLYPINLAYELVCTALSIIRMGRNIRILQCQYFCRPSSSLTRFLNLDNSKNQIIRYKLQDWHFITSCVDVNLKIPSKFIKSNLMAIKYQIGTDRGQSYINYNLCGIVRHWKSRRGALLEIPCLRKAIKTKPTLRVCRPVVVTKLSLGLGFSRHSATDQWKPTTGIAPPEIISSTVGGVKISSTSRSLCESEIKDR